MKTYLTLTQTNMKRLITLCLIALGMTLANIGQANAAGKKDGMKINYVLKNIGVNREVQAKLKPLLASYLADKRNANKEYDSMKAKLEPSINSGTITEKQAQRLLDLKWQAAEKELAVKRQYETKFKTVLNTKKTFLCFDLINDKKSKMLGEDKKDDKED